ncbi:MAG: hypothetical protein CV089_00265 [Nitrospira sp. WS110]|nr:hypothetical protein [Nitrospira sp. WS110]
MESSAIPKDDQSSHRERSFEKTVVSILGFIFGLVAFLSLIVVVLPNVLRGWAESRLNDLLVHKVEIEHLDLNVLTGKIAIDGFRIRSKGDGLDLMVIQQITADVDVFALVRRNISLKRLELFSPVVHLVRTEDSLWNVPTIGKRDSSSDSETGISFTIQNAVLRDGSLTIEDRSVSPTRNEQVNDIELTLHDVSPASSDPAKIHGSAVVSDSGTIMIDGTILPDLRSGNLHVDLTDISLAPVQGAFSDHLRLQGRVTARLAMTWPGTGQSFFKISGTLEGQDIGLSSAGHRLGHAATVSASTVEVTWPEKIAVDRLLVNQPEIWIRRDEGGRFVRFQREKDDSPQPVPASRSDDKRVDSGPLSPQWRIGKVVVRSGTVHLEDESVDPAYSDVIQNLEMTLKDVMPTAEHAVMINARADIASGGALDLRGRAALFGSTPSASFKAAIHRFVVPSTNSYLKRAVSHYTTEGTLTTRMNIRLRGDRLEVLSDVTLSDLEVEPIQNATHRTVQERIGLPLSLLLTLLKDETGRIHITFPISGPLFNPTFDWTNAIWTTLRNAVVKLITLPIRSIGRFIMGNHQVDELPLDPIIFDPGSSTIRPDMDRKLHNLARLLHSAKRTVLHMTPILSPADLEALRHLPPESWPIPVLDTPETARHVLAVRRAYLVAARLAGLKKVPTVRLPVDPPRHDTSDVVGPRVELQLVKGDETSRMERSLSGSRP